MCSYMVDLHMLSVHSFVHEVLSDTQKGLYDFTYVFSVFIVSCA